MIGELAPFFIVLFAAVFFSELFFRFHFPWVVALVLGGVLIGPSGFGVFESNQIIDFLGEIGLVFLMFMAGLESHLLGKKHIDTYFPYIKIALLSSLIPFLVGVSVSKLFGFDLITSLFIGITFISSSVAAILPTLDNKGLLKKQIGQTIVSSVIISDVVSLIALSVLLQITHPVTKLPLLIFYPLLLIILILLRFIIPKLFTLYGTEAEGVKSPYHQDLRIVLLILVGVSLSFQLLGLHPVVAGFFAGVILSNTLTSIALYENIRAVSYGIFIPIFFVVVGVNTFIPDLFTDTSILIFTIALTAAAIGSKLISGFIAGKLINFSNKKSMLVGVSTIPQLSTTLAVAFTALEAGIIGVELVGALVIVSLITTTLGVSFMSKISKNVEE